MVDGAIRLYRANFVTLIKISAIVLGPIVLLGLLGELSLGSTDIAAIENLDPATTDPAEVLSMFFTAERIALFAVTGILSLLGTILVEAASITAIGQYYQGTEPDASGSLRAALSRFIPILLASILVAIGATFGLIFCILPGIALFVFWSLTTPAIVTEQLAATEGMRRSWQLVKGRFWPIFGAIILAYILYIIAGQIIGFVFGAVTFAGASDGTVSNLPGLIASGIVEIVVAPFLAAMLTIIYFDARVRKEGYDLELMAQEIARLEQVGAPPPRSDNDDDPFGLGSPDS